MKFSGLPAALAVTALVSASASPALAAEDVLDHGSPQTRSGMFAGLDISLPFRPSSGSGRAMRPVARLQAGFRHRSQDPQSGRPPVTRQSSLLELGVSRSGNARFSVAGSDPRQLGRRLGMSSGAAIGIGVGVGVVAVLGLALAAGGCGDACAAGLE